MVENRWKNNTYSLKIDWIQHKIHKDQFQVFFGKETSGRSYVSSANKKVVLYSDVRLNSIAHEFGHVLGFTDKYYTVWDSKNCKYIFEEKQDDIMSSPEEGLVLPEHWEILINKYK